MNKHILIVITLFAFGCDRNNTVSENSTLDEGVGVAISSQSKSSPNGFRSIDPIDKGLKLIKTGSIEFESDDLDATTKGILSAIKKHGGYASNESESKSAFRQNKIITIRVPASKFDVLLEDISSGVDRFDNREISVSDVTEEFFDIVTRLKTKKEIETRYIQLLSKAGNITEILEVEKHIGEMRIEIEGIEGRLKYLNSQVGYSTLTVTYYEQSEVRATLEKGFFAKMANNFIRGWDLILGMILGLVTIWPILFIGIGGYYVYRRLRKKKNV